MTKPEAEGSSSELAAVNSQRLYGCHSNVVYGRSQLLDGMYLDFYRRKTRFINGLLLLVSVDKPYMFFFVSSLFVPHRSPSFGVTTDSRDFSLFGHKSFFRCKHVVRL